MRLVKLAIANVRTTVGAVHANAERIVVAARTIAGESVTVVCFSRNLRSVFTII